MQPSVAARRPALRLDPLLLRAGEDESCFTDNLMIVPRGYGLIHIMPSLQPCYISCTYDQLLMPVYSAPSEELQRALATSDAARAELAQRVQELERELVERRRQHNEDVRSLQGAC